MKYSLSSRQSPEYLAKADEIKVQYRDRNIIPDLFEKYPKATVNLTRYYMDCDENIDWKQINIFHVLGQGRFIIGLSLPDEMAEARSRGYKFYYLSPARTFQELNDHIRAGVCYVRLGAPLFFQMDKVKKFNIPVRATANAANNDTLFERPNGATGVWIRPEDVGIYEPYIDVLEFVGNKTQEQALYRIYAEQHAWSGELGLIIKDLNYPCTNRMVPPTLAETRLNCGQKCQENDKCHLCFRTFDLANPELIHNYLDATKEN